MVLAVAVLAGQAAAGPVDDLCAALARQAERTEGIPPGLVHALALAESGRWLADEGATRPWPWTVTSGRDSFFLSSKPEALRKIHELRAAGRSNIDVGCMQVNLGYHGHAFASVAEALEPASNVAYAARFLKRLRAETRSWARATAHYHSRHPERGRAYREKVFRYWEEVQSGRVAERMPVRLVGTPQAADAGASPPAPDSGARLIVPGRAATDRSPSSGAISIVRGGATRRDG